MRAWRRHKGGRGAEFRLRQSKSVFDCRNKTGIHLGKAKAAQTQILEGCSNMIKFLLINYHKPVMEQSRIFDRQGRVLRIEFLNIQVA